MNEHEKIRVSNIRKRINSSSVVFDGQGDFCFEYSCTDNLNTILRKMCKVISNSTSNNVKKFVYDTEDSKLKITLQDDTEFETDRLDTYFSTVGHTHDVSEINNFESSVNALISEKSSYTHTQVTASNIWVITHNLGFNPAGIVVLDTANEPWFGDVTYINNNSLQINFNNASFSGKAYLS